MTQRNTTTQGYRPAFTLPSTFTTTYYVDGNGALHDAQEYDQAGDFYDLLGNVVPSVKIATGVYVGTGTAGSGNRNTLTFAFEPKLVIIHGQTQRASNPAYDYGYTIMVRPATRYETIVTDASGAYTGSIVWDDNEVYWYSSGDAGLQFNQSGQQYEYFALG